ncbi:MAG TPA: IS1634 family transposase [Acidimicrobiales bacterium]|nr:IS1634 family transposase [Acidimicrobiales bacterium]
MGKKQGGRTYYYLVESARVGGKPRIVSQRYLGSAEEIAQRLSESGPGEPDRTRHLGFGDLAAVWGMLGRLGVADIIDEVVGPRRADAAASVGTYIALAVANRVVDPCSKLAFAKWWATTAGDRWVRVPAGTLDHRRFWDAMDAISEAQLTEIERRIVARLVEVFDVDVSGLALDMTNFATYIDSGNDRAPIAQRGHAKQKRTDLRLVGLGLVVSVDGGVPLVSHAYAGNRPDVTQFPAVVDELARRFGPLAAAGGELTVVYDAGQNSEDNQERIDQSGLHCVGSLPPSDHPDLLAIPTRRYRVVDARRFPGLRAFETRKQALGAQRRIVVTHSQNLHDNQARGFDQTLAKARRQLTELAARLKRGKTRKSRDKVEAEIVKILRPRWLDRVISTSLAGDKPAELRLTWRTNPNARAALEAELFGKRILFTDHDDRSVAEIVAYYRSQSEAEADFRQMKDPKVVSFSPMFHWTDHKIRVHVCYCVLALTVARLMRREAQRAGITMSVRELLDTLAGIQETVLLYQGERGRPRARRMLTDTDPTQQRLYNLFGLDTYAPTR